VHGVKRTGIVKLLYLKHIKWFNPVRDDNKRRMTEALVGLAIGGAVKFVQYSVLFVLLIWVLNLISKT